MARNESLTRSRAQENDLAERFGGRRTPGSGNQWHTKNDVRSKTHSFEAKTTKAAQYPLKASELVEGEKQALLDGRDFVFVVEMKGRSWAVIPLEDLEFLLAKDDG